MTPQEKIFKKIYKLALKSQKLATIQRKTTNTVGDILEKIHPQLEEELRDGYSFLNEMMDYGDAIYNENEIIRQIESALSSLKEKSK